MLTPRRMAEEKQSFGAASKNLLKDSGLTSGADQVKDLAGAAMTLATSKEGMEPIIDLVENKAQLSCLTPLSFVFVFVMGSALVINGSALIGPYNLLPSSAKAPHKIQSLCRSPVHSLIHTTLSPIVGSKLAFVGGHLAWTAMLGPPVDQ